MSANDPGFIAALEEAKKGFAEGGVPIGACLVAADGKILGRGHNMRVQKGSAILHVCSSIGTIYYKTHFLTEDFCRVRRLLSKMLADFLCVNLQARRENSF